MALPAELDRNTRDLVGHGLELDALDAAWQRARAGRLGVVAVSGEPGTGKT